MRHLLHLLPMLFLSQLGAQISLTTSIGLAETYCNVQGDPNNCFNVPTGNTNLTYQPGVDGDYAVTYKINNNSGSAITQMSISDTKHGAVFPANLVNIAAGGTYFVTKRYDSTTIPGSNLITATAILQNAAGASTNKTSDYTLDVLAPVLTITEFGIGRTKNTDVCTSSDQNPVCFTLAGTTEITVGAGDSISAYFRWQNAGEGTIDRVTFLDNNVSPNQGIIEGDRPQDLAPNGISFGTAFFKAPDSPGTYNRTFRITAIDFAGNERSVLVLYKLLVTQPLLEIREFGIGRTKNADVCKQTDSNPECFSLEGTTSITVGAGDSISAYFQWQNVGDGIIDNISFSDSNISPNQGIVESDRPQDMNPNEISFGTAFFKAPDLPGTYNRTLTMTSTDIAGNETQSSVVYTLIVTEPLLSIIEFGIGRTKNNGVCTASDPNPECFTLDGTTSITVGARDSISTYFQWQNVGDGIIDNIDFSDSNIEPNQGIVESDRPQDISPNQISFGTAFFEAPDLPGNYNRTFTLTSTDIAGNETQTSVDYTIIVTEPLLTVTEFGIGRTKDNGVCTASDSNPVCFSLDGTTSITVGARDSISTYFQWHNVGDGIIDKISFSDSNIEPNQGIVESDRPQDMEPNGVSFGTAFFVAPDAPGTYNRTLTMTPTDLAGNQNPIAVNYTIIVDCSIADFAPPITLCKDTTIIISPGQTVNLTPGKLNDGSSDNCGGSISGAISQSTFSCADVGDNNVVLTVTDTVGNMSTCNSIVTILLDPNIPFTAGTDQVSCTNTITLDATIPPQGMKIGWSIVSGSGGIISNPLSPTSMFTGVRGETYIIRWTHKNNSGTCEFSDDVEIILLEQPTIANAGVDQSICSSLTPLAGNQAVIGTGSWAIISGIGGSVVDSNLNNSLFIGLQGSSYQLEWRIENGVCTASSDIVQITTYKLPSTADAGTDIESCNTLVGIQAGTPTIGSGTWTIIEGAGGSILDSSSPITDFSGIKGVSYELEWTVANGTCIVSRDTTQIIILQDPSVALAGSDQVVSNDSTTLNATSPSVGIGSWTLLTGFGGVITDFTSPKSQFSGIFGETYELAWTVSNGSCVVTRDTVSITLQALPPTSADAGDDVVLCSTITMLNGNSPLIGSGSWSIIAGIGGSITNVLSHSSTFSGVAGETYFLQWTTEHDGLSSSNQVRVRFANNNEVIDNNYLVDWENVDIIRSSDSITVEAMMAFDFNKTLKAGLEIEFAPNAELEAGAQLEITIEACED